MMQPGYKNDEGFTGWGSLSPVASTSECRQIQHGRKRRLIAFTDNPVLQRANIDLAATSRDIRRCYTPHLTGSFAGRRDCPLGTDGEEVKRYRDIAQDHAQRIEAMVSGSGTQDLQMGLFSTAVLDYSHFLANLPDTFCINSANEAVFGELAAAIDAASDGVAQGTRRFEERFSRFAQQAATLLRAIRAESQAINSSSRDFRRAAQAVRAYDEFSRPLDIEVWRLSQGIQRMDAELAALLGAAESDLSAALHQMESNLESVAGVFLQQQRATESAFQIWEAQDGLLGYQRYENILRLVEDVLIPEFNDFLSRIPLTARIDRAADLAQASYDQMVGNFEAFPTFNSLPDASDAFPYIPLYAPDCPYGAPELIEILKRAAVSHFTATGKKLGIGNMSFQHGGKLHPCSSPHRGNAVDIAVFEIGAYPANDKAGALAAATRFLSAGANRVWYADPEVVRKANDWAEENQVPGRLYLESRHTGHFHLHA